MPEPLNLSGDAGRNPEGDLARDPSWVHGISRDRHERLPAEKQARFAQHAEAAASGFLGWVCVNPPDAVTPPREAGLLVWSHRDDFGPGKAGESSATDTTAADQRSPGRNRS